MIQTEGVYKLHTNEKMRQEWKRKKLQTPSKLESCDCVAGCVNTNCCCCCCCCCCWWFVEDDVETSTNLSRTSVALSHTLNHSIASVRDSPSIRRAFISRTRSPTGMEKSWRSLQISWRFEILDNLIISVNRTRLLVFYYNFSMKWKLLTKIQYILDRIQ